MSYFDDNYNGGDGSDNEEKKSVSSSEDEDEEEENISVASDNEEGEVEIISDDDEDEDDDDAGKGLENDDDDNEDEKQPIKNPQSPPASDNESDVEENIAPKKKTKKLPATKQKGPSVAAMLADEEDDDDDPTGEVYLQKFDKEINDNYLVNFHPESAVHNYDEILAMTKVIRDKNGIIIDNLHKTIPYLTKYEKARVLGQRAKQINSGAPVFVKVPEKVIDGYLIAELELQEKRIPFIIRRPLPNGGSEYWSIKDLENISF